MTDRIKHLDACIDLCKQNNVEVILVTGVTSVMRMYVTGNYQGAVDFYTTYAKSRNVPYYNLNYLKGREDFLPDEFMYDHNHVNADGASLVSEKFAEILVKATKGEDISSYFYKDLDEFKNDVHRIVAVKGIINKDSEDESLYHIKFSSLQNDNVHVVYRALIRRPGQEEYEVVRDWTPETEIDLTLNDTEGSVLRIEAGSTDETYGHAFQEYEL